MDDQIIPDPASEESVVRLGQRVRLHELVNEASGNRIDVLADLGTDRMSAIKRGQVSLARVMGQVTGTEDRPV